MIAVIALPVLCTLTAFTAFFAGVYVSKKSVEPKDEVSRPQIMHLLHKKNSGKKTPKVRDDKQAWQKENNRSLDN